jgi:diguanylate cyclase (GGDEF)-like protein
MRNFYATLVSGIGRRVALSVAATALLVLIIAIVATARSNQLEYRVLRQQQVDQVAGQAALMVHGRIGSAVAMLQSLTSAYALEHFDDSALREQFDHTGLFTWTGLVKPDANGVASGGLRRFVFGPVQLAALESGASIAVIATSPSGAAELYLAKQMGEANGRRVLILELSSDWLWSPLRTMSSEFQLVALNSDGLQLYGTGNRSSEILGLFTGRLQSSDQSGTSQSVAWQSESAAWIGSMMVLPRLPGAGSPTLALVAGAADRPWSIHLMKSLSTIGSLGFLAIVLAVVAAALVSRRYVPALRQLRRALTQLSDHQPAPLEYSQAGEEVQSVVDAFNRSAQIIERQRETQSTLAEIDALLIGSVEFETVVDKVLERIRDVTHARCVGVTLIDTDAAGHGRLFTVSTQRESPVVRIMLDTQMMATLCESKAGLTVVRCEEIRHSFLIPLLADGAQYFWVWPVTVGDRLVAILSIGYAESPELGQRVAGYGTECARRLGSSLSTNARSERLYRQAHFDPLTELPNRLLFRDRLAQELAAVANSATRGALLYVDLDHFKKVNDTLGHDAGDQLLSIIAQRLRACVKDGDTVARQGGDEFTILLRHVVEPGAASAVADRIIHSLQMPVSISGKDHQVKASIGITMFPDHGSTMDELLRNADLAMYRAKDMGRGTAVFFEPKMASRGKVADSGLYRALKRREFSLYYQPQYSISDGRLISVEALLRWQTPKDGMRTSAEFIPAAEESGLIVDLGGWVLEAACSQIAQWREQGLDPPTVAVNLSVQQLRDTSFGGLVKRLLERYQLSTAALEFELNEAALTDTDSQETIAELDAMNLGLILDDFGTGHTALNNLRRYPVRAVKIDRSFVDEVAVSASAAALASTIIVMAHAVNKRVVAEGVETIEQLDFLRERGCDLAQGYYLARPLPAAAMSDLLIGRQPIADADLAASA